jgi:hypothetical protein
MGVGAWDLAGKMCKSDKIIIVIEGFDDYDIMFG